MLTTSGLPTQEVFMAGIFQPLTPALTAKQVEAESKSRRRRRRRKGGKGGGRKTRSRTTD